MRFCVLPLVCASVLAPDAFSATDLSTQDVIREVIGHSGVCLHIGAGNGVLTAEFAKAERLVVHGLERDAKKVWQARDRLSEAGLYGLVAIERWAAEGLPYASSIANVVIAQSSIPESELLRVLVPDGIGYVEKAGKWVTVKKPRASDLDEWTHWRHGADGNMVSADAQVETPAGVRWIAGPAQDPGGQRWYYDHVLITANGRNYYVYENEIIARDSFNGVLLWRRAVTANVFREVGTEVPEFLRAKVKRAGRPSKVRPVAIDKTLYVAAEGKLAALDGISGATVGDFGAVDTPRELLVVSNTIVVSDANAVRGYNTQSRHKLWETSISPERIVAGDGKVFCLAGKTIAAIDIETGTELWRTENPEADPATTCTYSSGVLILEISSWRDDAAGTGVIAYSGEEGKVLWKKEYKPDMTHYKEARAMFARGYVWLQSGPNQIVGHDPKTGEPKQTWTSRGKHCATPVATGRYFIAPECDFTDLETGARSRARMFKSACRMPFIPANGLLYTFPVQCECFPMLRGYMGLSGENEAPAATSKDDFERFAEARPAREITGGQNEWPMYRRDVYRSGSTPFSLGKISAKQGWAVRLSTAKRSSLEDEWADSPFTHGKLTPPVAAEGKVFVALPDVHRVVAVDAKTGKRVWNFTAGGRVDLPPTIQDGLCLFGAHDGWVYCLDSNDGKLLWRRRVALQDKKIAAYGQIESSWPAPGSVLVENGIGYISAGRHPMSDGGIQVIAFKPRTGDLVWRKQVDDLSGVITNWYGPTIAPRVKTGLDFDPMDVLVKDGEAVAMSRWRFKPDSGDLELAVKSTNYVALGQSIPRGAWGYGIRQTKQVLPRAAIAFNEREVHMAGTNALAVILVGDVPVTAFGNEIVFGHAKIAVGSPVVRDGLIAAYGRLYASTEQGELVCIE